MKKILLSNGGNATVSDEDFNKLSSHKWMRKYTGHNNIAITTTKPRIAMHTAILEPVKGLVVDHKNGNGLDNTRENIRVVSSAENSRNTRIPINNTSGYKGVVWSKSARKWNARITVNYKRISLGYYTDILEAAKTYNKAATKYFGEYANLNKLV